MSAATNLRRVFRLNYGKDIESEIERLVSAMQRRETMLAHYPARYVALKLLEDDPAIVSRVTQLPDGEALLRLARERAAYLKSIYQEDVELLIADRRYGFINGLTRQVVHRPAVDRLTLTDRLDDLVTHRWLGLPIFFAMMYVVFRLVIDVSAPYVDWMDSVLSGLVAGWIRVLLGVLHAPEWFVSLVIEGVLAGVGGVLVFVPTLLMLYFFLAVLEDSGYLARAAFVMDRFMRVVGLQGKSFIPLILGFGCAVPAIYATRTLAGRRDRMLTALLVPLMSCSARLPVYVVFGLAFFGSLAGSVVWLLYLIGILAAALAGIIFSRTLLKPDATSTFVLELPPYRRPAARSVLIHMWEHTRAFIYKAGTLIVIVSILMWLLLNLPWGVANQRDSYFGQLSAALAPIFEPLGFGGWDTAGALVSGFIAKEVVISTMSQIYVGQEESAEVPLRTPPSLGEQVAELLSSFARATLDSITILLNTIPGVNLARPDIEPGNTVLTAALQQRFSSLSALAFLVFVLLYVPCVATLGAMRHEFGAGWALVSAGYQTALAWLTAFVVYQSGRLFGLE